MQYIDLKIINSYIILSKDYSKEEIMYLISLAEELKKKKYVKPCDPGVMGHLLSGKNIVLLFDKTSTRTRCSFEVAEIGRAHV